MLEFLQSYSLHDFLIFSPESFFKLFELSNKTLWPFHIPLLLSALVAVFFLFKRYQQAVRFIYLWLALVWGFVGFWYFGQFYSQINTYAYLGSYVFYAEAFLLFIAAQFTGNALKAPHKKWKRVLGTGLISYGVLIHPIVSLSIWDNPLIRSELFAIAPDPTAIASLGFILFLPVKGYGLLMVIPSFWLLLSVVTFTTF